MDRNELLAGFETAFLDYTSQSNVAYRPEFLSNDYTRGQKVLVSIEQELANCDEFCISVAFITKSGITPLLQTLKELENKGVRGKILTTDYLSFSEPEALEKIESLSNIELKMFRTNDETGGFHTKGYIFRKEELYRIIIGSSNMTLSALTKNREWNTKLVAAETGEVAQQVLQEFDSLWNDPQTQSYEEFSGEYQLAFLRSKMIRDQQRMAMQEQIVSMDRYRLVPNKMQVAFLRSLLELIRNNTQRALLISSTGTGKTFASAFAVREMNPSKILFIAHREQIVKQSMKSYQRVFGEGKTYGLISGNRREMDADFEFATMQMMSKPEIQEHFRRDEFDIIILDECHHAGAKSYERILEYFKPGFCLGMTASPDTNQYDIYKVFDHNIAYEITLQQALEEDLLCPFHYFGITDIEINGVTFDDTTGLRNFAYLVSDERVKYVLEKAEYFGYSGDRVKGLIFCSRKEEARELSLKFNQSHKKDGSLYRTEVLTGEDTQTRREEIIERLAGEESEASLDYVFTVDIFNEGVDIPEINQVIMLRPTQSPVVFVQQLGRGLRKAEGKEYVVILDFIGNYTNNFMIPLALSGDRSYNKDTMRRYMREGSRVIPGSSTIHFDEISKRRIYSSIDTARTNDMKLIRESYQQLKYKLGRIPKVLEFKQYGSIDITKIFEKCGSYYAFLKKYEKEYETRLSAAEGIVIEYLSKKVVSYKRIHEIALLQALTQREPRLDSYREWMMRRFQIRVNRETETSVFRNLTNQFPKEEEKRKYANCVLVEKTADGNYCLTPEFAEMLKNPDFAEMVAELLEYGRQRCEENYANRYRDTNFQLYEKYNYEDVCRLLNWKKNMNAQNIGGYFYDADTKTLPVFINYEKAEDAIAYEDRFISENQLIALSKHPRKITSGDVNHIYKKTSEDQNNRIYLFVRKNKDDNEAKEFYFLGEIFAEDDPIPIHMESTNDDAFEINYRLDVPVRSDIYDYIVKD